jgi:hypothetical protein
MGYSSRKVRLSEWCGTKEELRELANIVQLSECEYREELWNLMREHSSRELARDAYDRGVDGALELKNLKLFKGDRGTIGGYCPIGKYGEALRRRDLEKSWCGAWNPDLWYLIVAWCAVVLVCFSIAIFLDDRAFALTTKVTGLDRYVDWPLLGPKLTPEQLSRIPTRRTVDSLRTQRGGGRASMHPHPWHRVGANPRGWEAAAT